MRTRIHRRFNFPTRMTLFEKVDGYVDRRISLKERLQTLKEEKGLERIYRFDLGENSEGFSPLVKNYLDDLVTQPLRKTYTNLYIYKFAVRFLLRKVLKNKVFEWI